MLRRVLIDEVELGSVDAEISRRGTVCFMSTVTRRCPYCDTALEYELSGGRLLTFTAHDDDFCRDLTRHRVQLLNRAIVAQQEAYERAFASYRRQVDEMLSRHGLPSLEDQAKRSAEEAVLSFTGIQFVGETP